MRSKSYGADLLEPSLSVARFVLAIVTIYHSHTLNGKSEALLRIKTFAFSINL